MTAIAMLAAAVSGLAGDVNPQEREQFLRTAELIARKSLSTGVTQSTKATLRLGEREHAAHVQTVDVRQTIFQSDRGSEINFRDSYKYNIAAYEIAKMLDIDTVPVSVERKIRGQLAAFTWWVDNAAMNDLERRKQHLHPPNAADWNRQMATVKLFDELIANVDRNAGNLVITTDWQIYMIDHTRAFRLWAHCPNLKTISRVDQHLLDKMRELDAGMLKQRVGKYLTELEIKAVLARRDKIVSEFDTRIAADGESSVTYQLAKRVVPQ
jgi:hypothetical protein